MFLLFSLCVPQCVVCFTVHADVPKLTKPSPAPHTSPSAKPRILGSKPTLGKDGKVAVAGSGKQGTAVDRQAASGLQIVLPVATRVSNTSKLSEQILDSSQDMKIRSIQDKKSSSVVNKKPSSIQDKKPGGVMDKKPVVPRVTKPVSSAAAREQKP